jgi:hypothetical protein
VAEAFRRGGLKCSRGHRSTFWCLTVLGVRGSLSLADHWCHCNICGKDRGKCMMRTVCMNVACILVLCYMVVLTCGWMLSSLGVLAVCVELGSCYNPVHSACRNVMEVRGTCIQS